MENGIKTLDVNKKNQNSLKTKSIHNLTARTKLENVMPAQGKVLIKIKAWPAQSHEGIFAPNDHIIIRGEKYIAEVLAVGKNVTAFRAGQIITSSMYAGYHVATEDGHAKILTDTDILTFKENKNMDNVGAFNPETFNPGINFVLVAINTAKEEKTAAGIIVNTAREQSKNDAITKLGKVLKIGDQNAYGSQFSMPAVGSHVIIDGTVGDKLNDVTTQNDMEYRVVFVFDILGYLKE